MFQLPSFARSPDRPGKSYCNEMFNDLKCDVLSQNIQIRPINLEIVVCYAFCLSVLRFVSLFSLFCVYVSVFMHFRIYLFVYRIHCQLKFNFYLIFSDNENKKKTISYLHRMSVYVRFSFFTKLII